MNEIIVYKDGKIVMRFVESSFMISREQFDYSYVIEDIDKINILPLSVRELYKTWHKFSTCDGTNPTLTYRSKEGPYEYKFINWYWD